MKREASLGRPQMLFLCQTMPYPPDGGVTIRTFHILRLLARAYDIKALCFFRAIDRPTPEHVAQSVKMLSEFADVEAFAIPQEHSTVRYVADHLRSLLGRRAYTLHAYESQPMRRRIRELLDEQQFDIVHVDSLDLAGYLPCFNGTPVVCVHHNVESELLRRRAEGTTSRVVSWYLRQQAGLLAAEEQRWCPRVAMNVTVSDVDARKLAALARGAATAVVPNGVDTAAFRPEPGREEGIVFVGGANWFPNRDALDFFAADILPHIRARAGDVPVRWVGRASLELQQQFADCAELTGYVEDVRPYIRDAAVYVVPLRVGGGTRLKILDAWSSGKAVVSTSVGCEGLAARDGENILIRDHPADFADAVSLLLENPKLRKDLGRRARETVERLYSWDVIGQGMIELYGRLLRPATRFPHEPAPQAKRVLQA